MSEQIRVNINGTITGAAEARISIFDRGFLYGDSIYEVVRTYRGEPFGFQAHFDRLARSAAALALELPWDGPALRNEIARTLESSELSEAYVRIVVTRGIGEFGLDPTASPDATWVVIVRPIKTLGPEAYAQGVSVAITKVQRNPREALDPAIKSGNYLNNILALNEAKAAGAHEAIMLDANGHVAEGASSNVYAVKDRIIFTPPLSVGILEGVTRHNVLELARNAGIEVREERFGPELLREADEVFISSSIREIVPVTQVDAAPVANGAVGEISRRVMALYRERTRALGA